MITIVISIIIISIIYYLFASLQKRFFLEDEKIMRNRRIRLAMDVISDSIRNAGINPSGMLISGTTVGFITAEETKLDVLSDLNGDEDTNDQNEIINIFYNGPNYRIEKNLMFIDHITSLSFKYFDGSGNPIATPVPQNNLKNIRKIEVTIKGHTESEDSMDPVGFNFKGTSVDGTGTCPTKIVTSTLIPLNINN